MIAHARMFGNWLHSVCGNTWQTVGDYKISGSYMMQSGQKIYNQSEWCFPLSPAIYYSDSLTWITLHSEVRANQILIAGGYVIPGVQGGFSFADLSKC